MPAHPRAYQHMAREIAGASTSARRDELLDEWLDWRDRATEWDADQWGFNPDAWCLKERDEMDRRAESEERDI